MPDKRMHVEKRTTSDDYAVRRAGSKRASEVKKTQKQAIKAAKTLQPASKPRVERVRKGRPKGSVCDSRSDRRPYSARRDQILELRN